MLRELIQALLFIFVAEMGDKSQLLAMAFALRFSLPQVLAGVALGSLFNHGLAVALGTYLAHIVPFNIIKLVAACGFIGFGLWQLAQYEHEDEEDTTKQGHPIVVVALAFFIGELGDKTQLTAIALASNANFPLAILGGTVLGMVLTSLVGIYVGVKLGEKVPELALKLISSGVFIVFGVYSLWQAVPEGMLTPLNTSLFASVLLIVITILVIPPLFHKNSKNRYGQMRRLARELRYQLVEIEAAVNDICVTEKKCGNCREGLCPISHCKKIVREAIKQERAAMWGGPHYDHARVKRSLMRLKSQYAPCDEWDSIEQAIAQIDKLSKGHQMRS